MTVGAGNLPRDAVTASAERTHDIGDDDGGGVRCGSAELGEHDTLRIGPNQLDLREGELRRLAEREPDHARGDSKERAIGRLRFSQHSVREEHRGPDENERDDGQCPAAKGSHHSFYPAASLRGSAPLGAHVRARFVY